ncbi:SDR family NAD(P)-dependent oxidoreductase [Vicingus serpentipes]|uniref:SDR family NAD(P)-dependent oxidoreductase n=1 Tax=Vicingus serpentipes TaxID=1926625 RepID=A0A5C6RRN5_9FLAO|nr:SDR family NAD(P)-dependent oxidoreductase [Vicingus serpentipes]TXB64624.1 SDR family NAD(P)-dependent oxidoreductase [Vicingus serpentipes]
MKAVITGATRGVGRASAFMLAQEGYDLALSSRNISDLEQLKLELESKFGNSVFIQQADLSIKEEAINFSENIIEKFNKIEVLINNIGKYNVSKLTDSDSDLELMINTNLNSAYYISKNIAVNMGNNNSGHIFNICSVLSLKPRIEAATYTISKHALKGFNDVLREEMREHNVKVTAIYPGSINTSSWDGIIAPKEKFVQPEDIAKTIKTCLSISKNANIEEIVINPLDKNY